MNATHIQGTDVHDICTERRGNTNIDPVVTEDNKSKRMSSELRKADGKERTRPMLPRYSSAPTIKASSRNLYRLSTEFGRHPDDSSFTFGTLGAEQPHQYETPYFCPRLGPKLAPGKAIEASAADALVYDFKESKPLDLAIPIDQLPTIVSDEGDDFDESSTSYAEDTDSVESMASPGQEMEKHAEVPGSSHPKLAPFPLLDQSVNIEMAITQVAQFCKVSPSQVRDILPSSPLQAGLIALTTTQPEAYVTTNTFEIGQNIEIDKLRLAWSQVVARNPILRTRLVNLASAECHALVQTVLDEQILWHDHREPGEPKEKNNEEPLMGLGTPLSHFTVVTSHDGSHQLIWKIHHALYDGWSLPLLLKEVENTYYKQPSPHLRPMADFISFLQSRDLVAERNFWRSYFDGVKDNHFPTTPQDHRPKPDSEISLNFCDLRWNQSRFTHATILKAAWAVAVANGAGPNEALFGLIVSGRQAPLDGIELIAGPTIATVPLRIQLDWATSLHNILDSVQSQGVDMLPFEQAGIKEISGISDDAATGCNFQSLLVVQPSDSSDEGPENCFLSEIKDDSIGSSSDTYPIVVECDPRDDGALVRIAYDSNVIGKEQMNFAVDNFQHALRTLSDNDNGDEQLEIVRDASWDLHQIWAWNKDVPQAVDNCIHHLITARAAERLSSPAIDAWDGKFTYDDLEKLSTDLALHLVDQDVSGKVVPLLFEKSKWMPIAAVAVMKAGGGCLALDVKQPHTRLQSILSQIGAPLIISSVRNQNLARELGFEEPIIVGPNADWSSSPTSRLPHIRPSDTLYINFTSGSTGVPKGAITTHGNFCSAIKYQQESLKFSSSSRVLDFSSYAFDASWCNSLHSFTSGACLCIPSEEERLDDLAGCFKKYNITSVDLTPSTARALDRETLSQLSTLILGGEAVVPSDAFLAGEQTKIINVYGPAECTATVTLAEIKPGSISIGRGAGVCTWVIDPETQMPTRVGNVGELWIEGPLVGQGYFNNRENTEKAFIEDPVWLTSGIPDRPIRAGVSGRQGRLYRTGDLVRYDRDGSLIYIGRKDTQVKIRGQRVELEEIEQHILNALPANVTARVTAETIKPNGSRGMTVVAFVTLEMKDGLLVTEEGHDQGVRQATEGLTSRLEEIIPAYLVPASFIPIFKLPLMNTGKADRKALRQMAESTFLDYRTNNTTFDEETGGSLSDTEKILQQVWMSVLNLSAREVSTTKSFVKLGGDSITAMQVVAQCKLHSLVFTVSDLLKASTIKKLATCCKKSPSSERPTKDSATDTETSPDSFNLTPIQQMFFDAYPNGLNHFSQSFILELSRPTPSKRLHRAMDALVRRHPMLRCRFQKSEIGIWSQRVLDENEADTYAFVEHDVQDNCQVLGISQRRQEILSLQDGPVFACDLFQTSDSRQLITLSAHHAVIDLVSWRVIWGDIEDFVEHGKIISHPTASFQTWSRHQAKTGATLSPLSVLPYPVTDSQLGFWGLEQRENTFAECVTFGETFDEKTTAALFGESNGALHTEPVDIIAGCLAYTFGQTFSERETPVIWNEGHGREHSDEMPFDVSATVGWFTTLFPLAIPISSESSMVDAIRFAKDRRRQIPNKGQSYFSCRYYSEAGREIFRGHQLPEVTLNFSGQFQQLENEEGLFKRPEDDGNLFDELVEVSLDAQRLTMIEVNAGVVDGKFQVSFGIHQKMRHQGRLEEWIKLFGETLETTTKNLSQMAPQFTLTDLPLLSISYKGLDVLFTEQLPRAGIKPIQVVDVYPCSPLQEGILLSAQKEAASYATWSVWRCVPSLNCIVDPSQLCKAWEAVIKRHTILQTVFDAHPEGKGFIQILLSKIKPRTELLKTDSESPEEVLLSLERPVFASNEPEHAFTVCQSATGQVACRLDISHSLIDGTSMSCLVQDIISAYSGIDKVPAPPFVEMIRYIHSIPRAQRINSWVKFLKGVQPCEFPVSRIISRTAVAECPDQVSLPSNLLCKIAGFCKDFDITRSVFIQVAWAMTLSHFTGKQEVCFGYLASGRDSPIEDIDNMVGPLASMLISRISLRESPYRVLQKTSKDAIDHLCIQHTSMAEIQHHLGLSDRLFNTALSIRGSDQPDNDRNQTLSLEVCSGEDPHEFDIGLSASINGDETDVALDFRQPNVSPNLANEAAVVLTKAIRYLIDVVGNEFETNEPPKGLYGGFFEHLVGQDEDATRSFWLDQFTGLEGSHFPAIKSDYQPKIDRKITLPLSQLEILRSSRFKFTTLVKAAWALLASRMTGTGEALFGTTSDDGHFIVPARVIVNLDLTVGGFLQKIEDQTQKLEKFERTSVHLIRSLSPEAELGCEFQTVLQVIDGSQTPLAIDDSCALIVRLDTSTVPTLHVHHDSGVLGHQQALRIGHQLKHVLQQLLDAVSSDKKVGELNLTSPQDIEEIWSWNCKVPESIDACVHELFTREALENPSSPAVCAWDGNLTYRELDDLSTKLAKELFRRNIGSGSIVPLFFEKSMWMPVAALAVMKAGAAPVATDTTTQPEERLRAIVEQTQARVCLTSISNTDLARRLGTDIVVVGSDQFDVVNIEHLPPRVSPDDLAYITFTSGSSGNPKGVLISHRNMCSALFHQTKRLGYRENSRVLDFTSYSFDVFWSNLLNTLTSGGCFCIPSIEERQNDLSGALRKYDVTLADLTPSMARHVVGLDSLHTLVLGGEVVLPSDRALASETASVESAYGPAECTPTTTILDLSGTGKGGIGRGVGVNTWVVDPDNPSQLSPIGAVGELWLEGPLVGHGYLSDKEYAAQSFVQDPEWLIRGVPDGLSGRRGRLYRTGDLVQYDEDGSLLFIGRRDTQVKLRGQRIELEEVEHGIEEALQAKDRKLSDSHVVVEVIEPQESDNKMLAAFVSLGDTEEDHDATVRRVSLSLTEELAGTLPSYMIPQAVIPLKDIPRIPTGKIDRRQIRAMGSQLTANEMAQLSRVDSEHSEPETEMEHQLRSWWSKVIGVEEESISVEDNFFRLGGDSIGAMKLVGLARQDGFYSLAVRDIFRNPVLRDLARLESWT